MCKMSFFVAFVVGAFPFVLCRSDLRGGGHGFNKEMKETDLFSAEGHNFHRSPLNVDFVVVNITVPSNSDSPFTTYVQAKEGGWFSVLLTPIAAPSVPPTEGPTVAPSIAPSEGPTLLPTVAPSIQPTVAPSLQPSICPTESPTLAPSCTPTIMPTIVPTCSPSILPTQCPSLLPTIRPSMSPTVAPTKNPTVLPTTAPTTQLCWCYNGLPYYPPTVQPSQCPSVTPTISMAPSISLVPTSLTYLPPASVFYTFEPSDLSANSYLLNEATGAHDGQILSGASLNSTVHKIGSSSLRTTGSVGSYLMSNVNIIVRGTATYAFWVNVAACSPDNNYAYVWTLYQHVGAGQMSFYIDKNCQPGLLSWGGGDHPAILPALSLNVWNHFVWTMASDGTWNVYQNGQLVYSTSGGSLYYTYTITIGHGGPDASEPYQHNFNGYVDNFYIFLSTLTPNEAQLIYNQGIPTLMPTFAPSA